MKKLKHISDMFLPFNGYVSGLSFFYCVMQTSMDFSIKMNSRQPFSVFLHNAKHSGLASFFCVSKILQINGARYISQIGKCVVCPVSVFVVDVVLRPFTSHVEPSKPMASKTSFEHSYLKVSKAINTSGNCSNWRGSRCLPLDAPSEDPSFRVVIKKFAQNLRGKIGLSHDAVLSLIGQKPRRVSSTSGLRYFTVGATK